MTQPFIVIGDKTSHGGTVVGGTSTATTHGKQIARVGDKVTCPKCGSTTIATGDNSMIVMGQPVARHGDKTACGATLIAGQSVTTTGAGGGGSSSAGSGRAASSNANAATSHLGDTRHAQAAFSNPDQQAAPAEPAAPPQSHHGEPSGSQWVARYPVSTSTTDLVQPFAGNVDKFIAALRAGGASVVISTTYRPPERAYLMHWSYKIGHDGADPTTVPAMQGVNIDWAHLDSEGKPNLAEARKAAEQMVRGYDIVYAPALDTRHTERRAIDMTITHYFGKTFTDGAGHQTKVATNSDLYALGRSYGVIKLVHDHPHWSDDGH